MTVTLFLDFDGVLHTPWATHARLFERAGILEAAIPQLGPIEIVISSSWAADKSLPQLKDLLSGYPILHGLIAGSTDQISGVPDDLSYMPSRQGQCLSWLRLHGRPSGLWLAIDDDRLNFDALERVVLTNARHGLTVDDISELITRITLLRENRLLPSW